MAGFSFWPRTFQDLILPIKAVLFDIDGTLVDSNDHHVFAWQKAFETVGVHLDFQIIHDQIGKGADLLVPTLLPHLEKAQQEKVGDIHGKIFKSHFLREVRPFHGARDILAHVRACGQGVVLASSASKAELYHYLDLLDARGLVNAMTSGDDVEKTKPAPDIFSTALKKAAPLQPHEAIVVGDTPYDVEAAKKCGIATVALRSGKFADEALKNAGAKCLYDDVAALLDDYDNSPLTA